MVKASENLLDVLAPSPGESVTEVQLVKWLAKDGDIIKKNQTILEIESEKASLQLVAEKAGLIKILEQEGKVVSPGTKIAVIDISKTETSNNIQPPSNPSLQPETEIDDDSILNKEDAKTGSKKIPSPAAQKIIAENDIQLSGINSSGKDGRVTKGDALKALAEEKLSDKKSIAEQTNTNQTQDFSIATAEINRQESRQRMSQLRKKIASRLVSVKNETAMLTTFNEVNLQMIIDIRKKYKGLFKEKHQVGLGFMSFFAKACTMGLLEFPILNSRLEDDEIVTSNYVDLGIAVSAPKGLMVPVIRNAEKLSLADIEKSIVNLASKAKTGSLSMDEMTGGTFTITNGGVFGSMLSTPIINPPQSAILGMHNIVERAVVENKEIVIRPVMYLALSYDHRIVDGKDSVSFLFHVKSLLEDPIRLLLNT